MASTHFNENLHREKIVSKTGEQYYKVVWPKYKEGEEVVEERSIPPTFGNDVCPIENNFECAIYFPLTYGSYSEF